MTSKPAELNFLTLEEVSKHNTENDLYCIINNAIYDLTKFIKFHPGGKSVLKDYAGKDATTVFFEQHRVEVLKKYDRLRIGQLINTTFKKSWPEVDELSTVPYAESSYWGGFKSTYFNDSHTRVRKDVRKFLEEEIMPRGQAIELNGTEVPTEMFQKMGKAGLLIAQLGPGPWMKFWNGKLPGGIKPSEFDYFHELVVHEEFARMGYPGLADGLSAGYVIGMPALLQFAPKALQQRVVMPILNGDKRICLAISEAFAGSDVAGLRTTARKTPDGKHYIVNGTKKWISSGNASDFFVTAVRTGGEGMGGISLLFIERGPGVNTEKISTSYSAAAGTAFVTFDDVKVPVENLMGVENRGFECIMYNFNHERWVISVACIRSCRLIVEECIKWAHQRKVFGKQLIEQPVIRNKLARMISELEAVNAWSENITYQMNKMTYKEQSKYLAGPIALCKLQATRVAYLTSDHAVQIFGGRGITKTGMGSKVEHFQRALKYGAILGGSEEIMAELGIKQAMKYFPKSAKL